MSNVGGGDVKPNNKWFALGTNFLIVLVFFVLQVFVNRLTFNPGVSTEFVSPTIDAEMLPEARLMVLEVLVEAGASINIDALISDTIDHAGQHNQKSADRKSRQIWFSDNILFELEKCGKLPDANSLEDCYRTILTDTPKDAPRVERMVAFLKGGGSAIVRDKIVELRKKIRHPENQIDLMEKLDQFSNFAAKTAYVARIAGESSISFPVLTNEGSDSGKFKSWSDIENQAGTMQTVVQSQKETLPLDNNAYHTGADVWWTALQNSFFPTFLFFVAQVAAYFGFLGDAARPFFVKIGASN